MLKTVVINDHYRLREEEVGYSPFIRELDDSREGHMLAIAPRSVYILAACLAWSFVACLAITLLMHRYGKKLVFVGNS